MVTLPLEFLQNLLGKTAGEITEALKDGEEFKSQEEIESFIKESYDASILKAKSSTRKEGFDWGKKKFLADKEKELREKFGVEGVDLDEIIEHAVEDARKSSKLNPDDVKNSEVFINETKRLKTIIKEKEDEIASKEANFTRAEIMRVAKEQGLKFLNDKKFVMPDDDDIRDEHLSNLFEKLENSETKLSIIDGKIVVLDANGRPKENDKGTAELSFEDYFSTRAKRYFPQAVADNRQSPGNKNIDKPGDTKKEKSINNIDDLYKALNNERDPAKLKELKAEYDLAVKDGTI
jgi:hypothetical protein